MEQGLTGPQQTRTVWQCGLMNLKTGNFSSRWPIRWTQLAISLGSVLWRSTLRGNDSTFYPIREVLPKASRLKLSFLTSQTCLGSRLSILALSNYHTITLETLLRRRPSKASKMLPPTHSRSLGLASVTILN